MKKYILFLLPVIAFAKVHYAKVEPYERATIKSTVSGIVLEANQSAEGSVLGEGAFVQVDDRLDRQNLKNTIESIKLFQENLKLNQEILKGLKATLDRRKDYFYKLNSLESASKTQKDNAYAAYVGAKNQYLGTKEKIITLKKQITDLGYKKAMLEDTISKKRISFPGKYLYSLMVHKGEFVAPGAPVAIIDNISKAKLELYLDREELVGIEDKVILVDGNKTDLHIDKIWKVADAQYISSYKATIILPPKYQFSKLLKIEFK